MKYVYPVILIPLDEDNFKGYGVDFPDFKVAGTEGLDLYDALYMAEDYLNMILIDMENDGREIPEPSDIGAINVAEDSFVTLIKADTDAYRADLEELNKNSTEDSEINEDEEDDEDYYISEWLAERIFKEAGIKQ